MLLKGSNFSTEEYLSDGVEKEGKCSRERKGYVGKPRGGKELGSFHSRIR